MTGPAERFELVLSQFARYDDGGKQSDAHADEDALLHGFNAGELGDVAGAYVLQGESALKAETVSAACLGEQERLTCEVRGAYGAAGGERMRAVTEENDAFGLQSEELKSGVGDLVAHGEGEVELAGVELAEERVAELTAEDDFDVGITATEDAEDGRQAVSQEAFRR